MPKVLEAIDDDTKNTVFSLYPKYSRNFIFWND